MGVLLALDHFLLTSNSEANIMWLVDFVDSKAVRKFRKAMIIPFFAVLTL